MIDIKIVREHADLLRQSVKLRHLNTERVNVDRLVELDGKWRDLQGRCDALRGQRNEASDQIKKLQGDARQQAVEQVKALKLELGQLETQLEETSAARDQLLRLMPNLLGDDVPRGETDAQNAEISKWGSPVKTFDFEPKDHVTLGQITDTLDFDRAAKVTGASFYYLKREAVLLELALCQLAASRLVSAGYVPMTTPDLARDQILEGIGFAPRGPEAQIYSIADTDLCLVGTAEITVGGYHRDEILDEATLPRRYMGLSHCFRTEAGAHGRESKGLYRVHQFTKAEMFILCRPDQSAALHEEIRQHEEALLRSLNIPYRVVNVCAGDLGAPAAKKYDIEAWMPGRNMYGEVTSCSNCTDYQARRLNVRYRPEGGGSPHFVHMLNGTAIAISRTLIAIYENYQNSDGSITIPEVLRPWTNCDKIPARP